MELEVGAIVEGKVTGITNFGAFVSLPGGRSGLVHISEVAYSYVSDVSEFLTVGQDVQVKIINVDDSNRINLSIKQTLPPPARPERTGKGTRDNRGGRDGGRDPRGPRENRGEGKDFRSDRAPRENRDGGKDFRSDRGPRPNGAPKGGRPERSFNRTPAEPQSFDDMLKQFMSDSESKQSELNRGGERGGRGGRRGGGGGRRNNGNSSYDF